MSVTRRVFMVLGFGLAPATLGAQVGLAVRGSTLGVGAELSMRSGKHLGLRLGGNYFQFSRDITVESNRYTATPHFENGTAMVDLYPFGGALHLTGGVILNYNEGRLAAHLPITLNGRDYTPSEVTELSASVTFKRAAPYAGIGLSGQGRVSVLLDLGVGFTATPIVALSGETTLTGAERDEFDARLAQEQENVQLEVNRHSWLKYHPVLSFGLKFGF